MHNAAIVRGLHKAGRTEETRTRLEAMKDLPESRDTAHAFETFGELLVTSGRLAELDQCLARMPHETARTHTRLGVLRAITKPLEAAASP